jgi:hypothetical protein
MSLIIVVTFALIDLNGIWPHTIDQTIHLVNAAAPVAAQVTL